MEKRSASCSAEVFRLVFHPGNHAVFLKQAKKTEGGGWAPIPEVSQATDACPELAAPESGAGIVNTGGQDIRHVELGLEPGEFLSFLLENWVCLGFSPEQCVAAVHTVTVSNTRFHDRFISDRAAGWGIVVPILVPIPSFCFNYVTSVCLLISGQLVQNENFCPDPLFEIWPTTDLRAIHLASGYQGAVLLFDYNLITNRFEFLRKPP